MTILKRTILAFFIGLAACVYCPAASAEDAVLEFRIGLIGADPGQLLLDFDPFVHYLRSRLRRSGFRGVSLFVAKDLNQMRAWIQKGKLDFILATAFPIIEMEHHEMVPSVVALNGAARDETAVFFVRKRSSLRELGELRGKSVVFGTPSSTAAYAMAIAELKKNNLSLSKSTDQDVPGDAIRYTFAGEAINQAVQVIRSGADAGVFSSSDWEKLSPKAQSRLRIIHRTEPVTRLLGSFHTSFPPALREVIEKNLIDMSGNRKGRTALTTAQSMTSFDRLTGEDMKSLQRLKQQL